MQFLSASQAIAQMVSLWRALLIFKASSLYHHRFLTFNINCEVGRHIKEQKCVCISSLTVKVVILLVQTVHMPQVRAVHGKLLY
jgi:hypothetical protein